MKYDYRCDRCGSVTEAERRIAERDAAPECCGGPMRRLMASPRIITHEWCYSMFPHGLSLKDRIAEAREAERAYERKWNDAVPTSDPLPKKDVRLRDIAMEVARERGIRLT